MAKADGANVEANQGGEGGGDVGVAEQGNAEVQKHVDSLTEKGYDGEPGDPTPNENYTVAGVTSGAPTPETDKEAAAKVREHQEKLAADNGKYGQQ